MKITTTTVSRACRAFWSDRRGNVAIIFALSLVPIMGLVGAAVDYSRGNNARVKLQAAVDSTILNLSQDAATIVAAQGVSGLQARAEALFSAMYTMPHDPLVTTYDATARTLEIKATAQVANTPFYMFFSHVMGGNQQSMPIGSSGMAKWGTRLRVAFALDNTGSMSQYNKLPALKTAVAGSGGAIDQLSALNNTAGDVYISIVPFAAYVNAGASNYNQTWIDWTQWEAPPANSMPSASVGPGSPCPWDGSAGYVCTRVPLTGPANMPNCIPGYGGSDCITSILNSGTYSGYICPSMDSGAVMPARAYRFYNGCYNSTWGGIWTATGSTASCGTRSNCTCAGSGAAKVCTQNGWVHSWVVNNHNTWGGCLTDRGTAAGPATSTTPGTDQRNDQPSGTPDTNWPADQAYSAVIPCPVQMRALNNDWSAMKTFVNGLSAGGSTNQPIGLVWAWQSLVGGGPLTAPAKISGYQYDDIIILLSDGLNTQDRWYGTGSAVETRVDDRMAGAAGTCQNIKNAGVTIYTIQVNTDGDPTSTLLRNCATDTNKFFLLTQSGQIPTTFNQIIRDISKLRVAR